MEIAERIKQTLIAERQVKDPVVTVDFANLHYAVMGEVNIPGQYALHKDVVTIFDAISTAGDLTIYGKRNKVSLTRTVGDKRITYLLDLRSAAIYNSPAYYLQQGDLLYVEPNGAKSNQSTGNNLRSISLWISIASFLTTISVLIFK